MKYSSTKLDHATCTVQNVERLEDDLVFVHVLPEGQVVHQHRHQLRHRHQRRADEDKPEMKRVKMIQFVVVVVYLVTILASRQWGLIFVCHMVIS